MVTMLQWADDWLILGFRGRRSNPTPLQPRHNQEELDGNDKLYRNLAALNYQKGLHINTTNNVAIEKM